MRAALDLYAVVCFSHNFCFSNVKFSQNGHTVSFSLEYFVSSIIDAYFVNIYVYIYITLLIKIINKLLIKSTIYNFMCLNGLPICMHSGIVKTEIVFLLV